MVQHLILMGSACAFGYMVAVPQLTTLTDRIDAQYILMIGSALSGLTTALFGLIAKDLGSAVLIWGMGGTVRTMALSPFDAPGNMPLSYRINRQLSGWIPPPLMIRAFGAHCQ
jgi:hypothetical protein